MLLFVLTFKNTSYKHSKCQHCLKTFDCTDAVVKHCVSDHPDKYFSLLWSLLNDKCPGINDIGRGRQDARGTEKEGGRGEKIWRKKRRGEGQKEGRGRGRRDTTCTPE